MDQEASTIDPVFRAYMETQDLSPEDALRDGVDHEPLLRLKHLGLERFEGEELHGRRVIKSFSAWLSPQLEYSYSRQVVGERGMKPGGPVLKIHRSGFPSTLVTSMTGERIGRYILHPLLSGDAIVREASDLRPQFDIVVLWLAPGVEKATRPGSGES